MNDVTGKDPSLIFLFVWCYDALQSCYDIRDIELFKNIVDTSELPRTQEKLWYRMEVNVTLRIQARIPLAMKSSFGITI